MCDTEIFKYLVIPTIQLLSFRWYIIIRNKRLLEYRKNICMGVHFHNTFIFFSSSIQLLSALQKNWISIYGKNVTYRHKKLTSVFRFEIYKLNSKTFFFFFKEIESIVYTYAYLFITNNLNYIFVFTFISSYYYYWAGNNWIYSIFSTN